MGSTQSRRELPASANRAAPGVGDKITDEWAGADCLSVLVRLGVITSPGRQG
jgi:hypothetical protein